LGHTITGELSDAVSGSYNHRKAVARALERPASDFDSKGVGLTEALLKFSHQQYQRIAIEYVDRESMDQPIIVNLQNKTVR